MDNQGKISLLVVTLNSLQPKQIHDFTLPNGARLFKVFPADSMLRVKDYFTRRKFDLIIVDESFKEDFWGEFKNLDNKEVPVYFLALESYTDIDEKLSLGYKDVLFKPVDLPILLSKISNDAPKLISGDFLVKTDCTLNGEMKLKISISSISEAGAVLETDGALTKGTKLTLSIPGGATRPVVAEVISSKQGEGKTSAKVIFRGATNSFIQDIRRLMKSIFIAKKLD